jgi:hypothetical protein
MPRIGTHHANRQEEVNIMSKEVQVGQEDMFPVEPEIKNLGITRFRISGSQISADLAGVCNVHDIALVDVRCWQLAVAGWLVMLCNSEKRIAHDAIDEIVPTLNEVIEKRQSKMAA